MALLDEENGQDRRHGYRGKVPKYARMPRGGRVIIDPARLRYYRHARFMTRQQLADLARMSVESVKSYELGRMFPRESAFRRLVFALGIQPEQLLFDDCKYIRTEEEPSGRHRQGKEEDRAGTA